MICHWFFSRIKPVIFVDFFLQIKPLITQKIYEFLLLLCRIWLYIKMLNRKAIGNIRRKLLSIENFFFLQSSPDELHTKMIINAEIPIPKIGNFRLYLSIIWFYTKILNANVIENIDKKLFLSHKHVFRVFLTYYASSKWSFIDRRARKTVFARCDEQRAKFFRKKIFL